ncbi:MAG TPA: hypothetical protein PKG90_05000, partial [Chitinophagaceae bacterium]|nr:hypothetical protein [Chitinophagaceae bacterium]
MIINGYKIVLLSALTALFFNPGFCQGKIKIQSEEEYKLYFHKEINKYHDTLCKSLDSYYNFYVRFKINEGGFIDSIRFSVKRPAIMLEAVEHTLKGMPAIAKGKFSKSTWYVQPLEFNFFHDAKMVNGQICLCFKISKLDTVNWEANLNFNHNGLYDAGESEKGLLGIQCVFLRPIIILRTN